MSVIRTSVALHVFSWALFCWSAVFMVALQTVWCVGVEMRTRTRMWL
jgi:hypothetical protein